MATAGVWALLVAWMVGNPPMGAPDEEAHYNRMVGLHAGALVGEPFTGYVDSAEIGELENRWVEQAIRVVDVPAGLDSSGMSCFVRDITVPASCLDELRVNPDPVRLLSSVGTYQPLAYLLPALFSLPAGDPFSALLLGRLAAMLTCAALAWLTIRLTVHDARDLAGVIGVVLAFTPQVIFVGSALNPSGLEIFSGLALTAGLLALRPRAPRAAWVAMLVGGVGVCLGRSAGPAWVLVIGACALVWHGWRPVLATVRASPWAAGATAGGIAVAAALNRVWEAAHGPEVTTGLGPAVRAQLEQSLDITWRNLDEVVGNFGYLLVTPPSYYKWIWVAGLVIVVGLTWTFAPARRVRIGVIALAILLAPTLLDAYVLRHTGFRIQIRHVLPLWGLLPFTLAAALRGAAIPGPRDRVWVAKLLALAATLVALVQFLCWYFNGQVAAVGSAGRRLFFLSPAWDPALGWLPWLLLALAGATALWWSVRLAATRWLAPAEAATVEETAARGRPVNA